MWINGFDISLATIPMTGDPIIATRKLRRGLKDVRDRKSRQDRRWAAVTFSGLANGNRALVLAQHPTIDRDDVWTVLEQRWPSVVLSDVGVVEPLSWMIVDDAAALACRRRGIEPIRMFIPSQMDVADQGRWGRDLPMPMVC